MPVIKRLVCLANSRKLLHRCVAGKELVGGQPAAWIRPVSAREHEEVSEYERQYQDGSDPQVLDIMDVPLLDPRPKNYQQENWLLDPDQYWKKASVVTWDDLASLADAAASLWIDGHSTYNGRNDKIPRSLSASLTSSLRLLRVDRLGLAVFKPGEAFGNPKRRVQGHFQHAGCDYKLWITDPRYERAFLAKPDGEYEIGECYLTVSLGEPHKDACYKLIAAVIEPGSGPAA